MPKSRKRTQTLSLRISPEEKQYIKNRAKREGVSMTDCIMLAVLERPPTKGKENNRNTAGVLLQNTVKRHEWE